MSRTQRKGWSPRAGMLAAAAGALVLAPLAAAQDYTYLLLVDYGPGQSSVNPSNPSCTVRVWATLKASDYAWALGNLDLNADEAGWTDFDLELGTHGLLGASRGELSADQRVVQGVITGQFNSPFQNPARTDHPIQIWSGTWTNLESNYVPRTIDLGTLNTSVYKVYSTNSAVSTSVVEQFLPGAGEISVTPAPVSAACLLGVWVIAGRRRRSPRQSH